MPAVFNIFIFEYLPLPAVVCPEIQTVFVFNVIAPNPASIYIEFVPFPLIKNCDNDEFN